MCTVLTTVQVANAEWHVPSDCVLSAECLDLLKRILVRALPLSHEHVHGQLACSIGA